MSHMAQHQGYVLSIRRITNFTRFLPSSSEPYWRETGFALLFWRPVSPPPTPFDFPNTCKRAGFLLPIIIIIYDCYSLIQLLFIFSQLVIKRVYQRTLRSP